METKHTLLSGRKYWKPFTYPEFFDLGMKHKQGNWLPQEAPMFSDIDDWENKLSPAQQDFLTNIFRFFTQGDVDIASAYYTQYLPYFRLPEVTFMMGEFAAREGTHIVAYSYLIETIGMPESTYSDFLKFHEMKAKQDYINSFSESRHLLGTDSQNWTSNDKLHIATGIALFSGFVEGMQLFSTFAMLLIFPLNGLMTGMGKIVSWSIVDESEHVSGMMLLLKTFLQENPDICLKTLSNNVQKIAREMVDLEKAFIDLVFARYDSTEFFGMTPDKLKLYIEFIADHRLASMNIGKIYNTCKENPLPELAVMINAPSHTNFFENTSTDYADCCVTGNWSDVWEKSKDV